MAAVKVNPNYKPDKDEVFMFLDDLKKSAYTNLRGMLTFLIMEYPALPRKEAKKLFLDWIEKRKIPIKR